MSASSLAAMPAQAIQIAPAADAPTPANAPAPAAKAAVEVSLTAEAELTLSVVQRTTISISVGSAGGKDAQGSTDARAARALSTLEEVADAQRAWIKALKAQREGRHAQGSPDAQGQPSKAAAKAGAEGPAVQVSIEQDTEVQASLTLGAQIDVSA